MPQRILTRYAAMLRSAVEKWLADDASRMGAALAYYSLFSIGPLLMISISIAGLVFGEAAVSGEVFYQIRGLVGDQGAEAVQLLLQSVHRPESASLGGLIGGVTLLVGATSVVVQLKDSLNRIWRVEPKPGRGIIVFLRKYVLSLAAIMSLGFLLMISLVLSAALSAAGKLLAAAVPLAPLLLQAGDFALSFVLLTLLIGGIFKFLPDVELQLRTVLPGAAITTVLFLIGKSLIGLYLGRAGVSSTFGAAGSIVVVMIWIYYTAQIIYFGAELTETYARERQPDLQPSPDARFIEPCADAPPGHPAGVGAPS